MTLRKGLIGFGITALAVAWAVWVIHFRPKRELLAYKRQLVAAGEKLAVGELIPPAVAPDGNAAAIFLKAQSLLGKSQEIFNTTSPQAMRMVAPGKAAVGWRQPDLRDFYADEGTNAWQEAAAIITQIREGLQVLEGVIEHPTLDFGFEYYRGFSGYMRHLVPLKQSAQLLMYATVTDLHSRNTEAAVLHTRALVALVKGMTDERLLLSQLVRNAMAAIAFSSNWELLQSSALKDEQLAALQRDCTDLEFLRAVENALAMERAMGEMTIREMRESSAGFNKVTGGTLAGSPAAVHSDTWFNSLEHFVENSWDKTRYRAREAAWRVAWSYPDELLALKGIQILLETLRTAQTNGCVFPALQSQSNRLAALRFPENREDPLDIGFTGGDNLRSFFSKSVLPMRSEIVRRVMSMEAARQLTVTAIALERHRLRHGNYPGGLAALTPDYLAAVSHDPVDGKPLRYHATDDGRFTLYSVGEDGEDNGGDPRPANANSDSFAWDRGRDWVWPQPASPEQVRAYLESRRAKHRNDTRRAADHARPSRATN